MKKINEHPYELSLQDFKEKAEDAITLAEAMCEHFHDKKLETDEFQHEYLAVAIMTACIDSHKNGFKNGLHSHATLNEKTVAKFANYLPENERKELKDNFEIIKYLKKFVVWLMEPTATVQE